MLGVGLFCFYFRDVNIGGIFRGRLVVVGLGF